MKQLPPDLGTISHVSRRIENEVSMVVASGYLEVNGIHNVGEIVSELKRREIIINDIEEGRIMFLMEKESIDVIKREIALLKGIEDVRSVHLTYYSVENRQGFY
jgi:nitrate reductase NapAB chaperone NapD